MSLTTFGYAFQARVVQAKITIALGQSYSVNQQHKTKLMRDKLTDTQKEAQRQGFTQAALYALFGLWPFMWNKHDYTLPIIWLSLPIIALRIARTTIFDRSGSTLPTVSSNNGSAASKGPSRRSRKQSRSTFGGTWNRGRATSDVGTFEVNSPYLKTDGSSKAMIDTPRSPTIREGSAGLNRSSNTDEFEQVYLDDPAQDDKDLRVSFYELSAFLDDALPDEEDGNPSFQFRGSPTPSL
jgi:hypothetical protein